MVTDFLDSKSMQLWLLIFGLALIVIIFAAVFSWATGREPPFVQEFFGLLGVGGGTGTARNVMVDGPVRKAVAASSTLPAPSQSSMPGPPAGIS